MLVESRSDLEVGELSGFELSGPGFRYVGFAAVAHRSEGALGLRFVAWEGPVDHAIRALVAARLCRVQPGSHAPGNATTGHPTVWHSRKYERGAPSGLSMLIEAAPQAATSHHQVLNIGEQGMLIDGLELPVGAQISFVLAGRGINHAGSGRVAYRTDTTAGVAVDPWHEAPEAIRALISGETELGPRPKLKDAYINTSRTGPKWHKLSIGEHQSAEEQVTQQTTKLGASKTVSG